jgi:hypothetical protein
MSRNRKLSSFMKSLGPYRRPRPGERLETEYGKARVLGVVPYEEVAREMRDNGVPGGEIKAFDLRVEHFLGGKKRYFECELCYPDGEVERIDWSEYLALKNRSKR